MNFGERSLGGWAFIYTQHVIELVFRVGNPVS